MDTNDLLENYNYYPLSGYGIDLAAYHNEKYGEVLNYLIGSFDDLADGVENTPCAWDRRESSFHGAFIYIPEHPSVYDAPENYHDYSTKEANNKITDFFQAMLWQIQAADDVYYLEHPLTDQDIQDLTTSFYDFVKKEAENIEMVMKNDYSAEDEEN